MKKFEKISLLVLMTIILAMPVLSSLAGLAGCAASTPSGSSTETIQTSETMPSKLIVLAIHDMKDAVAASIAFSLRRLIEDNENLTVKILDAEGFQSRQLVQLWELNQMDPDALILIPSPGAADLSEPLDRLAKGGVPIILLNGQFSKSSVDLGEIIQIQFDAIEAGRQQAAFCIKQINGQGKIAILAGPKEAIATVEMIQGVREVLINYPEVKLADVQYGDGRQTSGRDNMTLIFQQNPDINAVIAQSDDMLLGAIPLIRERKANMATISLGATNEALKSLSQGNIDATISLSHQKTSQLAFNAIVAAISGQKTESQMVQPFLVSRDNLDEYIKSIWNIK